MDAMKPQTSSRPMLDHDNVAGGRLSQFSMDPPTGFKRDGYCKVTDDDKGNHSIAATMSESFLKFTNGRGNNLESAGVKPGMRWCLCASRWKEAYDAFKDGKLEKEAVPQVHLHCTDKKALDVVTYKDLKGFAAAPEATREGGRQGVTIDPAKPSQPHGEGEMSGTRPTQDQQYGTTKEMKSGGTTGAGAEQARRQTGRGG